MKKSANTTPTRPKSKDRLAVRREVVKQLTDAHLDNVVGGHNRQGCCSPMRTT